jgi:hypothetical protein
LFLTKLMGIIIIILLVVIAYYLYKIYSQKEGEIGEARDKAYQEESEKEFKEKYQGKYTYLIGKIENSWLETFVYNLEHGVPIHKLAYRLYFDAVYHREKSKSHSNSGAEVYWIDTGFDNLWNLTEELLEHLEKYHEGTKNEFEIAVAHYWQIAASEAKSFTDETDREVIIRKFQSAPFSNLSDIISWFPKKQGHPKDEISFVDKKTDLFPRKSKECFRK